MPTIIFYDGACGVCHGSVKWVLARDAAAEFRYAPLGGETFLELVPEATRARLPESVVVRLPDGTLCTEWRGVLAIAGGLGAPWRWLAAAGRCLPGVIGDAIYRLVARNRRRLAAAPKDGPCPLVAKELRARFLP